MAWRIPPKLRLLAYRRAGIAALTSPMVFWYHGDLRHGPSLPTAWDYGGVISLLILYLGGRAMVLGEEFPPHPGLSALGCGDGTCGGSAYHHRTVGTTVRGDPLA